MREKNIRVDLFLILLILFVLVIGFIFMIPIFNIPNNEVDEVDLAIKGPNMLVFSDSFEPVKITVSKEDVPLEPQTVVYPEIIDVDESVVDPIQISRSDIELLALLTVAEAESECEEGQRLVIDTVLNRVDSIYFPDTIYDVIYQKDHFSSMWNGRVDRCVITDDIVQLVMEELEVRSNTEVIYFNTRHYSKYGTPLFKVENHYFSKY